MRYSPRACRRSFSAARPMPDAELMRLSTVAGGIVAEAHAYLAHGGPENLGQLARFLSDAIALTGAGFEPPKRDADLGSAGTSRSGDGRPDGRGSSTTAPTSWPAMPTSSTRWRTPSRQRVDVPCRCSAPPCARRNPSSPTRCAQPTRSS